MIDSIKLFELFFYRHSTVTHCCKSESSSSGIDGRTSPKIIVGWIYSLKIVFLASNSVSSFEIVVFGKNLGIHLKDSEEGSLMEQVRNFEASLRELQKNYRKKLEGNLRDVVEVKKI